MNIDGISQSQPTQPQTGAVQNSEQIQAKQPNTGTQSTNTMQEQPQPTLNVSIKTLLNDLVAVLARRESIIQALPFEVKQAVRDIINQTLSGSELTQQGLASLVSAQKNVSDQLQTLANTLNAAAILQQQPAEDGITKALSTILSTVFNDDTTEKLPQTILKSDTSEVTKLVSQILQKNITENTSLKDLITQLKQQPSPQNTELTQQVVTSLVEQHKITPEKLQTLSRILSEALKANPQLSKDIPTSFTNLLSSISQGDIAKNFTAVLKSADSETARLCQQLLHQKLPENISSQDLIPLLKQPAQQGWETDRLFQQLLQQDLPENISLKDLISLLKQPAKQGGELARQELNTLVTTLKITPEKMQTLANMLDEILVLNPQTTENIPASVPDLLRKLARGDIASNLQILLESENKTAPLILQLLQESTLEDFKLLDFVFQLKQNPADSKQDVLADREKTMLRQLLDTLMQNIPQKVREMAVQHDMPELPETWALLHLQDAEKLAAKVPRSQLSQASSELRSLAASYQKAGPDHIAPGNEHSAISFSLPLVFGEDSKIYPAHIHIYHQREKDSNKSDERKFETWLRFSIATENVGVVDLLFRLYQGDQLDIRAKFDLPPAADMFTDNIPAIFNVFTDDLPFKLANISVV